MFKLVLYNNYDTNFFMLSDDFDKVSACEMLLSKVKSHDDFSAHHRMIIFGRADIKILEEEGNDTEDVVGVIYSPDDERKSGVRPNMGEDQKVEKLIRYLANENCTWFIKMKRIEFDKLYIVEN